MTYSIQPELKKKKAFCVFVIIVFVKKSELAAQSFIKIGIWQLVYVHTRHNL